jgi:hypothetical protein
MNQPITLSLLEAPASEILNAIQAVEEQQDDPEA